MSLEQQAPEATAELCVEVFEDRPATVLRVVHTFAASLRRCFSVDITADQPPKPQNRIDVSALFSVCYNRLLLASRLRQLNPAERTCLNASLSEEQDLLNLDMLCQHISQFFQVRRRQPSLQNSSNFPVRRFAAESSHKSQFLKFLQR